MSPLATKDRGASTSPSRYSSSTTSLYRSSRYALPFQHYALSSAYSHHFAPLSLGSTATSASTGYLLSATSPIRQRRRPWGERGTGGGGGGGGSGLYDRYDDSAVSTVYRHYDAGSSGENLLFTSYFDIEFIFQY